MEDIVTTTRQGPHFASVSIQEQSIQPVGESKSDYEIVAAIAEKLGYGDEFTGGLSTLDLQKIVFDAMKMDKLTTWEDFYEKKTYVYKTATDWEEDPPGFRLFYEDPKTNPLQTPSGLLEFYSERLAKHFPDDKERPPFPKWVEKGITHDERLSSERADMFPLLLMSNHPRWRTHAQGDDISWTRETPTGKVLGFDGYKYEPIWINPTDAAARGIKDGDVVKVFNERGIVLVRRPRVGTDHGPAWSTSTTAPGTTRWSPARWTAVAPSTPSPRTGSRPRTRAARPRAATWSTCRGSRTRNGRHGAGTTPMPSPGNTTKVRACASTPGSRKGKA